VEEAKCMGLMRHLPVLQCRKGFSIWHVERSHRIDGLNRCGRGDENGIRNSLLLAPMPTINMQILAIMSALNHIPQTSTPAEHSVVNSLSRNKHLLKDLVKLGIWTMGWNKNHCSQRLYSKHHRDSATH
jgi:hypothetical protein